MTATRAKRQTIRDAVAAFDPRRCLSGLFRNRDNQPQRWALRDINVSVSRGEVVGLIGANGAGKSTLLKILSRITPPSAGEAVLNGRAGSLLEVGTGFHPELSGRENIYLYGAILGMRHREITANFSQIVDYSGVGAQIDMPVKRYSSGMYVRLAFAVAAFLKTDILFVDEVLAVGDIEFQQRCLGTVKDLAGSGRTVIFVSHNMSVIQSLCQRVWVIDGGRLVFDGATEDGVRHYLRLQSRASVIALSERPRQRPARHIRFCDVSICSSENGQSAQLVTGAPAWFKFSVDIESAIKGVDIGFTIYDELGIAVGHLSTRYRGISADAAAQALTGGRNECVCMLPKLALLPGRYRINVVAQSGPENLDHVEDAATFEVVGGDYFGTGRLPQRGAVIIEHQWRWLPATGGSAYAA